MDDPPCVTIVLLGDPECGKSTFLSYALISLSLTPYPSTKNLPRKLSQGAGSLSSPTSNLPALRDEDQPFVYEIRMYNRPYRFEFYDTASPTNYTLLRPDFVILCYDISDRRTLKNLQNLWWRKTVEWYMQEREDIPLMVLGLKRDLRIESEETLYPQEGHRTATELRCDMYAECSAVTGELMGAVFEDIARRAAMTTTQKGGLSEMNCCAM